MTHTNNSQQVSKPNKRLPCRKQRKAQQKPNKPPISLVALQLQPKKKGQKESDDTEIKQAPKKQREEIRGAKRFIFKP